LNKKLLYSFHPEAIEQQTNIWIYTCQNWSEEQANMYIDGLHDKLSIIAKDFTLLRSLPNNIHPQVKFFHYERHYVFLKIAPNDCSESIQVLAILHDSMDISIKLREILR
jgi:toxin ParE1/3/4